MAQEFKIGDIVLADSTYAQSAMGISGLAVVDNIVPELEKIGLMELKLFTPASFIPPISLWHRIHIKYYSQEKLSQLEKIIFDIN